MPVPAWIAQVNKRIFNPMELRRGQRPVLVHTGRTSGTTYRTPLDAHPVEGGYVFFINYGAGKSDWVKNVMASGEATLVLGDREVALTTPRILSEAQAFELLPATVEPLPKWMNVTEFLSMSAPA